MIATEEWSEIPLTANLLSTESLEWTHLHRRECTQSIGQLIRREGVGNDLNGSQKRHEVRPKQIAESFHMQKSLGGDSITLINMNFIMSSIDTEFKIGGIRLIGLKILSHFGGKRWDLCKWIRFTGAGNCPGNPSAGVRWDKSHVRRKSVEQDLETN